MLPISTKHTVKLISDTLVLNLQFQKYDAWCERNLRNISRVFCLLSSQEPGRCRRIFSKHTLSHGLFNTFTNFSLTGALLTLQGSLIVFIALCDSTFGVPANKLRSADGALHNLKQSAHNNVHSSSPNEDSEGCEAVCSYCKDILSMRWAALCVDQCYKQGGGRAYDACYITFHLRDQIHWQCLAFKKIFINVAFLIHYLKPSIFCFVIITDYPSRTSIANRKKS